MRNREFGLRIYIALAIAIVWAIDDVAAIITQRSDLLIAVTPVMLIAAGYLLGTGIRNGRS